MEYDKKLPNGTVIKAPAFVQRVLDSVPIVFQIVEWLLVIVAFQYVDVRFGYVAAKVVWIVLALSLSLYLGVLGSNVAWRLFEDPFKNRRWRIFMYGVLPAVTGGLVVVLLNVVVRQMVLAHGGTP